MLASSSKHHCLWGPPHRASGIAVNSQSYTSVASVLDTCIFFIFFFLLYIFILFYFFGSAAIQNWSSLSVSYQVMGMLTNAFSSGSFTLPHFSSPSVFLAKPHFLHARVLCNACLWSGPSVFLFSLPASLSVSVTHSVSYYAKPDSTCHFLCVTCSLQISPVYHCLLITELFDLVGLNPNHRTF